MANTVEFMPVTYNGNGVTRNFPFKWKIIAAENIIVILQNEDGTRVTLTLNADYSVSFNRSTGGTVSTLVAPAAGQTVIIVRATPIIQETKYSTSTGFQGSEVEKSFDKTVAMVQEIDYENKRAIKVPVGSPVLNLTLPEPDAGKTLKWKSDNSGLENSEVNVDEIDSSIQLAKEYKEIAEQSAASASNSANNASEDAKSAEEFANSINPQELIISAQALPFCVNSAPENFLTHSDNIITANAPFTYKTAQSKTYTQSEPITNDLIGYEEISTPENAISNGSYAGFPASNAFDGVTTDYWRSSQADTQVNGNAAIGQQAIPAGKMINYLRIFQGFSSSNPAGHYNVTSAIFQISIDGINWTDVATLSMPDGYWNKWQELAIPVYTPPTVDYYFRLKANSNVVGGTSGGWLWLVNELEVYIGSGEFNGNVNIFANNGELEVFKNTVYRQTQKPQDPQENDVWFRTLIPLNAFKYNGVEWIEYTGVPVGMATIINGAVTSVEAFPLNQNGYNVNSQTNDWARAYPDYTRIQTRAANTIYQAAQYGFIKIILSSQSSAGSKLEISLDDKATWIQLGHFATTAASNAGGTFMYQISKGVHYRGTPLGGGNYDFIPAIGEN